jgi:RimJ/RimL family protein N-acetyltransferase
MYEPKSFRSKTTNKFDQIKKSESIWRLLRIRVNNRNGYMIPLTYQSLEESAYNLETVHNLSEWRRASEEWFQSKFEITDEGTRKWLKNQVLDIPDRILFIIISSDGTQIGHIGFYRGEIDNCLRGNFLPKYDGYMTDALLSLMDFGFKYLSIKELYLRTYTHNKKAINLYSRCGFKEIETIPLILNKDNNCWEESKEKISNPERTFSVMYKKGDS